MILQRLKLQLKILQLQLQVLLLRKKLTVPNLPDPIKIIIHHGGGDLDFNGVNNYHKGLWGFRSSLGYYAGYTYFIERSGKVIQARADNEEGAHTRGHNKNSIGICLQGNGELKDFTKEQYNALEELVERKTKEHKIEGIYGHRHFSNTLCPSFRLVNWIKLKVVK